MAGRWMFASILALAATGASAASIETFDVPGAVQGTIATGIDRKGDVFGYWRDENFHDRGFVRAPDGAITTFELPLAQNMATERADAAGDLTGDFFDGSLWRGFVRAPDGSITNFDAGSGDTFPIAINARRGIAGVRQNPNHHERGFVRRWDGKVTTIAVPGAMDTFAYAVTSDGSVAGYFFGDGEAAPLGGGFIRSPGNIYTTFSPDNSLWTMVTGMNADGTIAGHYTTSDSVDHGFVRAADGTITSFDPAGSIWTSVTTINAGGAILGSYNDTPGTFRGYIRATDGSIESFDAGGSGHTAPQAINDKGVVAGWFYGDDQTYHGFIRKP